MLFFSGFFSFFRDLRTSKKKIDIDGLNYHGSQTPAMRFTRGAIFLLLHVAMASANFWSRHLVAVSFDLFAISSANRTEKSPRLIQSVLRNLMFSWSSEHERILCLRHGHRRTHPSMCPFYKSYALYSRRQKSRSLPHTLPRSQSRSNPPCYLFVWSKFPCWDSGNGEKSGRQQKLFPNLFSPSPFHSSDSSFPIFSFSFA